MENRPDIFEITDPAAGTVMVPAVLGGGAGCGVFPFLFQKLRGNTGVDVIPGQRFGLRPGPGCVKVRIDAGLIKRGPPFFKIKIIVPPVQTASILKRSRQQR